MNSVPFATLNKRIWIGSTLLGGAEAQISALMIRSGVHSAQKVRGGAYGQWERKQSWMSQLKSMRSGLYVRKERVVSIGAGRGWRAYDTELRRAGEKTGESRKGCCKEMTQKQAQRDTKLFCRKVILC